MKKNSILALTAMLVLLTPTFIVPLLTVHAVSDSASWYKTENGVLTSDYYTLYPYTQQSIDLGFSKYGELINSTSGGSQPSDSTLRGVGLQYPGFDAVGTYDQRTGTSRDPFANELVTKNLWVNGWLINITYRNRIFEETGLPAYRVVWAFALFSDGITFGGPWQNHSFTPTIGAGGRQTNKLAVTDPIQTLYDGPREYIALLKTHIFDEQAVTGGTLTWPVADLYFTIIFNKVKKEVVIFKEVKILLETKYLEGLVNVQFGDRGEWDLGPATGVLKLKSYAEFYSSAQSMGLSTPYGWQWADYNGTGASQTVLLRDIVEHYVATAGQADFPTQHPMWDNVEAVFVNGIYQLPGINRDYIVTGGNTIHFNRFGGLSAGDKVSIQYKWAFEPWTKDYSLAQVISADGKFVGAAAFWPQLSDWTVDGWNRRLSALFNVQENTMNAEPAVPFVSGEWDFAMDTGQQWRGVETYVLTDNHDGVVAPMGKTANIDKEVKYQLNEVYNPFDLVQAIDKKDRQWVEFKQPYVGSITLQYTPFLLASQWDAYNVNAERVIDEYTGTLLVRGVDYEISYDPTTGVATIIGLSSAFYYDLIKIEYSTDINWSNSGTGSTLIADVINQPLTSTISASLNVKTELINDYTDPLDATWSAGVHGVAMTLGASPGDTLANQDETITITMLKTDAFDFKVYKLDLSKTYLAPNDWGTTNNTWATIDNEGSLNGTWMLTKPFAEILANGPDDLHVYSASAKFYLVVNFQSNATMYNMTVTLNVDAAYSESIGGRYEWIVVGRDASTVDSAGAAMIAASLRDKQVQVGLAGEDMMDPLLANQIPSVMAKLGTGNTPAAYKDTVNTTPQFRAALKDDWCTKWPITTSNLVSVGGPIANVLSYYVNDFTSALYGNPTFTPITSPWYGMIGAVPCWSKNAYTSSSTDGYAVIGTYLDINGTVVFTVWGMWGRDTYYASQWIHGDAARGILPGILTLENLNPGTTSLVLHIDYTDTKHPTFNIVENLGTISEKEPLHPDP